MQTGIPDAPIVAGMVADPGRNFVTKAVNWALHDIG
jgi:3-methyladenine DNA glycosylase AlkD